MNIEDLQISLRSRGLYMGALDGKYGLGTRTAVQAVLKTKVITYVLKPEDFAASAARLGLQPAHIRAVCSVEAAGSGFDAPTRMPTILFERNRFSIATHSKFDATNPNVSKQPWDHDYPTTTTARYGQLLEAVGLDVDAGFGSASYGMFQILGENFKACNYLSSFNFAVAQAYDELTQLRAFEAFITTTGAVKFLQKADWAGFARLYNGTAFRENHYDTRLAAAFKMYSH